MQSFALAEYLFKCVLFIFTTSFISGYPSRSYSTMAKIPEHERKKTWPQQQQQHLFQQQLGLSTSMLTTMITISGTIILIYRRQTLLYLPQQKLQLLLLRKMAIQTIWSIFLGISTATWCPPWTRGAQSSASSRSGIMTERSSTTSASRRSWTPSTPWTRAPGFSQNGIIWMTWAGWRVTPQARWSGPRQCGSSCCLRWVSPGSEASSMLFCRNIYHHFVLTHSRPPGQFGIWSLL